MPSIIEEFLEAYGREYDFYDRLAALCHQQCEAALRSSGVLFLPTFRTKRPASLRKKLEHRNRQKPYQTVQDIRDDIVDLAGVRIATYFPPDRAIVEEIVERTFDVREKRNFPSKSPPSSTLSWTKRFTGYAATHYRVTLKPSDTTERFSKTLVEIQIASVLMHAWAEVEHDLLYKPERTPSESEQAILDELNGLVIAGEIALERLRAAFLDRIKTQTAPFANHYDLAAYLHSLVTSRVGDYGAILMGRADILHEFLGRVHRCHPDGLKDILGAWTPDISARNKSLVEQAINHILLIHPEWFREYEAARQAVGERSPHNELDPGGSAMLERFLRAYIDFEHQLSGVIREHDVEDSLVPQRLGVLLERLLESSSPSSAELQSAANLRNQIVHRGDRPDPSTLASSIAALERAVGELRNKDSVLSRLVSETIAAYDTALPGPGHPIQPLEEAVKEFKRQYTIEALNQFGGNRTQTAKALNVDPRTIFRFLEKERSDGSPDT